MALLDDIEDAEGWKVPVSEPGPPNPDFPCDPHEETATKRLARVAARRAGMKLWAQVQAEIMKSHRS